MSFWKWLKEGRKLTFSSFTKIDEENFTEKLVRLKQELFGYLSELCNIIERERESFCKTGT